MTNRWPITWWEHTGEHTAFIDGVAQPIYRNLVTGECLPGRCLPFGACFATNRDPHTGAIRPTPYAAGHDQLSIVCVTPRTTPPDHAQAGCWYIDSRANNCTLPNDSTHRCWVRHGTVGQPLTVDKSGHTCQAGAGSIQNAGWHGFLKGGELYGD